ncbi:hypothetical protein CVT24_010436 [Panaeolus cyanescens]|uniref:Uncharacterized protein n=1 Tax=Panaeolus cyanescens TaxID=181874 RepID=A0A409YPQ2_9AGAR|nr:hypothetical protein CVT24_010436 [Panaeolus cyanescens]
MPPKKSQAKTSTGSGVQSNKVLSPELMTLVNKVPVNPVTGLPDVARFMEENPSEMEKLYQQLHKLNVDPTDSDLDSFNYSELKSTIAHESFWVLQIEPMGYVDAAGKPVEDDSAIHKPGVKPTFVLYCYDDAGKYRVTSDCVGLPSADLVLKTIKRAIAWPSAPLKPALPWFLLISIKFSQHVDALRPFLDSLPKPFHWRLETRQEAEGVRDGVDEINQKHIPMSMKLAEEAKLAGNQAFAAKNRPVAIKAYTEAINHLHDVMSQNPTEEQSSKAKKLMAICLSNLSATHLLPGTGQAAEPALKAGKTAEVADPSYAKAYARQASALVILGKKDEAIETIIRALKRKDLENESGLVDRLIELLTHGKGLSDDEAIFKQWAIDLIINDKRPFVKSLMDVKGEYRRRIDAQFAKFPKRS